MGDILEFPDLLQEVRGAMNPGRLKMQSNTLTFKNTKTGKIDQYQASDVEKTQWIIRARGHCLKVLFKSGTTQRFDGFRESDFEKLSDYLQKNYQCKLEKKDLSMKGWNWGVAKFNGNNLDFKVEGNTAFEIPLTNISHSATSKNEVTIEFHQNDDAPVSLMELRFHVPSDATGESDPVADFFQNVMAKADVIQATGDAITIFSETQCLTPRGRYDIKIYPAFLQLHGKTFDYKIPYTTILRLFLLPHRDGRQVFFVVSLDPPIKQGQTRYHFLILLFYKDAETTLELSLTDEDIDTKYEGKLQREMSGPEFELISRVMKVLLNKKITVPGSFLGHSGTNSIACSYKAATGSLYPLERGFIFMHKPPLHVRFDEISFINFARSAGSTRYFDFDIETKTGTAYSFVGIEKDEYGKLYDFVSQKKLRVKNVDKADSKAAPSYADDMEDSEDDDRVHNAYMNKMKAEGKDRNDVDPDDDDDESDESFKPEGSASEPDDEYDSNLESTSESDEEGGEKKEKKKEEGASNASSEEEEEAVDDGDDELKEVKPKKLEKKEEKKEKKIEKKKSESKPRKSKKTDTDPNKPKRGQTAFFLWLRDNRSVIKDEFPGISPTDLTRKAGERWKELTDKSKWEAMAAKEKEAYEAAMSDYKKNLKEASSSPPSGSSKKSKSKSSSKKSSTTTETSLGSGGAYKSKEFISDGEESDSDSGDKPPKKQKKEKKEEKKKKESSSEPDELPEDERILTTPESSGKEESADDSD